MRMRTWEVILHLFLSFDEGSIFVGKKCIMSVQQAIVGNVRVIVAILRHFSRSKWSTNLWQPIDTLLTLSSLHNNLILHQSLLLLLSYRVDLAA